MRRPTAAVVVSVAALFVASLAVTTPTASAGSSGLELRLRRASAEVSVRARDGRLFLDPRVYLVATGGNFELEQARPDYDTPFRVQQNLPDGGAMALPDDIVDGWMGLSRFFRLTVTDRHGEVRVDRIVSFCPNTWEKVRVGPLGPPEPIYPEFCGGWNPFMLGTVMGVEQDYGANLAQGAYDGMRMRLREGRYHVDVQIAPRYVDMFGIDQAAASTSVWLTVRDRRSGGGGGGGGVHAAHRPTGPARSVPAQRAPDPSILPDLVPLPSWGIDVMNRPHASFLTFGANVWVKGNGPLVVEGYRREGEDVMDAHQFFYRGGEVVGRAPVGQLEYDHRDGHEHWHFKQFATYQLLAEDGTTVVRSTKESFCLVPTDAIDLTLPSAELRPWQVGLHSACGSRDDLWIREVLPLGWGDTYYQWLPGQSFDITDLPNGTYHVKVIANPGHRLHETTFANNATLRQIIVRGRDGHRRVEVPPWHGIDTEGWVERYGTNPLVDG